MSERTVRIPSDALAQRLGRIEERVRALSLRTWPGAVRTAMEEGPITVTPTATPTPLVSVMAEPGRWVVFGHVQLWVNPLAAGRYQLEVNLAALDEDGVRVDLDDPNYDMHTRIAYQNGLNTSSAVWMPMTVIGHFTSEQIVMITLNANNFDQGATIDPSSPGTPLNPFGAANACLTMLPA